MRLSCPCPLSPAVVPSVLLLFLCRAIYPSIDPSIDRSSMISEKGSLCTECTIEFPKGAIIYTCTICSYNQCWYCNEKDTIGLRNRLVNPTVDAVYICIESLKMLREPAAEQHFQALGALDTHCLWDAPLEALAANRLWDTLLHDSDSRDGARLLPWLYESKILSTAVSALGTACDTDVCLLSITHLCEKRNCVVISLQLVLCFEEILARVTIPRSHRNVLLTYPVRQFENAAWTLT